MNIHTLLKYINLHKFTYLLSIFLFFCFYLGVGNNYCTAKGIKMNFATNKIYFSRNDMPQQAAKNLLVAFENGSLISANPANDNITQISPTNFRAYNNISFKPQGNLDVEFYGLNRPKDIIFSEYAPKLSQNIADIKTRVGKQGQFLNWISILPEAQLQNVDNIYANAEKAKQGGFDKLVVLGIGGSRHTTENMVNLLGLDNKVSFYSAVDSNSFNNFVKNVDLNRTKFLVVSKSGGTLETTTAYNRFKAYLEAKLGKEEAKNRFIAMTDANPEKSVLRRTATQEGYITGLVHDDVGGRFSIFDDATMFALAYSGMPKNNMVSMLIASQKAQEKFMNPDINKNLAAQQAVFNVYAAKNMRRSKHFVEYFGDMFKGSPFWETQLKNESLKHRLTTVSNVGPAFLHYNTESDLDTDNKDSMYSFITVKNNDKEYNALINGSLKAYSRLNPLSSIQLKDNSPESIAEYLELKHFETLYTGCLLRDSKEPPAVLPEVVQFNVQKYKDIVQQELKK